MRSFQFFLYPLSLLYGVIMMVRNLFYDLRIFNSVSFAVPVISIGNLSMGGTGKTPFTELLIRLLQENFFMAVLSRGYKRESKGFLLISKRSNVKYTGDEPLQLVKKFDLIKVALDEKRARGIRLLMEKYPELNVILMDDAFQHRSVRPGFSILLTDYYNLYSEDHVFPSGTLREFRSGAKRADVIVVTKTPRIFSPISKRRLIGDLRPDPHQHILFSYIRYSDPRPVSERSDFHQLPPKITTILLVTGIANDGPLREHLERMCTELIPLKFRDHHAFTQKDLEMISCRFRDIHTQKKVIITTEKDAMRLRTPELADYINSLPFYYIPMEMDFHGDDRETFEKLIFQHVAKNKRDR